MTSFIDLMKSDVWSEADIVNRTEAMVRTEFSAVSEAILNRKITGAGLGQYTLTEAEMGKLQGFALATEEARLAGTAARADMALLLEVMASEVAWKRLGMLPVEPVIESQTDPATEATTDVVVNQDALDTDDAERAAAQAVVAAASEAVTGWVLRRNPAPAPEVVLNNGVAPVEPA
jgi:hypothetical protein